MKFAQTISANQQPAYLRPDLMESGHQLGELMKRIKERPNAGVINLFCAFFAVEGCPAPGLRDL